MDKKCTDVDSGLDLPEVEVSKWDRKGFDLLVKKKAIARQIEFALRAQGMSKTELARRIGVSRPTIARILDPEANGVTFDVMYAAARTLGLSVTIEHEPVQVPVANSLSDKE